jgi:hypothetical protein
MLLPYSALIVPALLSAVAIFFMSSLIHMFSPWHKSDYSSVSDEDGLQAAMRPFNLTPDDYIVPRPKGMEGMKSPEYLERRNKGPVIVMTVMPSGTSFSMAPKMISWFVYVVAISLIAGCVAAGARGPGAEFQTVFHFVGVVSFIGYAGGLFPASIWFNKKWSTTCKSVVDSLIYAVITGLIFGWRWPAM